MKTYLALFFSLCAGILGVVPAQAAQRDRRSEDRDRVCVYQNNYYQGASQCYYPGDEISDLGGRRNSVSSIHVYGRARVTVFEDSNFRGNSTEFRSDVVDLARVSMSGSKTWNDRIGSLRVTSDNGGGNGRSGSNPPVYERGPGNSGNQQRVQNGICVYQNANYRGQSQCWSSGEDISDLSRTGWSNKISSIRVFGRVHAVAFNNTNFRGQNLVIDRDIPDLAQLRSGLGSWNDHISSIQITGERGRASRF
jgi:hypothetical protein